MKKIKPKNLLKIFIALNLIIGVFIVSDYGVSVDEPNVVERSWMALNSYNLNVFNDPPQFHRLLNGQYRGTAMTMIYLLVEHYIGGMLNAPAWAGMHFSYFVTFQISIIALYYFAKRYMSEWSAIGVVLLYATQPLFFGHAMINPKDIPLMSIVVIIMTLGFYAKDSISPMVGESEIEFSVHEGFLKIQADWKSKSEKLRGKLVVINSLWMATLFGFYIGQSLLTSFISYAFLSGESNWAGQLFLKAVSGSPGPSQIPYIEKAMIWYRQGFGAALVVVLVYQLYCNRIYFPLFATYFKERVIGPIVSQLKFKRLYTFSIHRPILFAAIPLGIGLSTRVISVTAGGMVGLYLILNLREKAIRPLFWYGVTAIVVSFITWPFLWFNGLGGLIRGLVLDSQFPWTGGILFEGSLLKPEDLPWYYLLKLMGMQFTEPLIILAISGFMLGIKEMFKGQLEKTDVGILVAWFFLPVFYVMFFKPTIYNNFRHFMFITIPIFIFAGLGLEKLFSLIHDNKIRVIIIAGFLAFGIIPIVKLHPYQYVYYNEFSGGVGNAFREFEMDYWLTSYKEAVDFVKQDSPDGAKILLWVGRFAEVYGDEEYAITFKNDILAGGRYEEMEFEDFDYVVIPSIFNLDTRNMIDAKVRYSVVRESAVLVKVVTP